MTIPSHEPGPPPHWSFDRRVNIAHIISTLSLAGVIGAYLVRHEARVVVLEEHRAAQIARDARQDADLKETRADVTMLFKDVRDEIRALRADLTNNAQRRP